jgi:FAD dependent oxidoreductase TIGR03364
MDKKAIVIGAGIVGLATARALAMQGYQVTVVERTHRATGASVRNFGMVWPVGQPDGALYERAMLSRSIWKTICDEAGIWYEPAGSLHLAYAPDEWAVINEYADKTSTERQCRILSAQEATEHSPAIVSDGLMGALWSPHEMIVDPREAIAAIPDWLQEKWGVEFVWGTAVTSIQYPAVYAGNKQFMADEVFICSGADFETLYPEIFSAAPITKCKLQMMRLAAQPENWRIGPSLCGGLSLTHYKGFSTAPSLGALKERYQREYPDYIKWGIHVMVSQNGAGEITAGDSHEYGGTHDPFDRQFINQLVLDYLKGFARFKDETIIETWNGIYPKLTNGEEHFIVSPEDGVTIINGLGGAGMTLSFGLCDQYIRGEGV